MQGLTPGRFSGNPRKVKPISPSVALRQTRKSPPFETEEMHEQGFAYSGMGFLSLLAMEMARKNHWTNLAETFLGRGEGGHPGKFLVFHKKIIGKAKQ